MPEFTKTQRKILEILKDGRRHRRDELIQVLPDQNGEDKVNSIQVHLCQLRKKINPTGHEVLVEFWQRKNYYRLVRIVGTGE